jgi:hypothetical protein
MTSDTNLPLPDGCLAVFVDDTGHEALVKGHPVYGLGGCAVMGRDFERVIWQPWREVRRRVTGSPDTPLHASEFSRFATQENIEAVADFFRSQPFARIGAIISIETKLANDLGPVATIAAVLQKRIVDIARWTPFDSLAIIFESSERADPLIQDAFQGFAIAEAGKPIPVDFYLMPKSAGEPALEVADFIMHAVGRQVRKNLARREGFALDYQAVFHSVDQRLVSYMEVGSVTPTWKSWIRTGARRLWRSLRCAWAWIRARAIS